MGVRMQGYDLPAEALLMISQLDDEEAEFQESSIVAQMRPY